ncbi:MAG: hypothetical protein GY816_20210 [Cytophagales bacterium]|nr:hypothetical protein [Cytophagales bacterium]
MKKFFLTILIFGFCSGLIQAQSNSYLKVYQNSDFFRRTERVYNPDLREYENIPHSQSNLYRISLAYGFSSSEKMGHEIEGSISQYFPPI